MIQINKIYDMIIFIQSLQLSLYNVKKENKKRNFLENVIDKFVWCKMWAALQVTIHYLPAYKAIWEVNSECLFTLSVHLIFKKKSGHFSALFYTHSNKLLYTLEYESF